MQKRLEPEGDSRKGFLAKGEIFEDVVEADIKLIHSLGTTHKEIATKLQDIIRISTDMESRRAEKNRSWEIHEEITYDGNVYIFSKITYRGAQQNPFKDNYPETYDSYPSWDCTLLNKIIGESVKFPGMAPYLIGDVHFFESHTPYRIDPEQMVKVLRLGK